MFKRVSEKTAENSEHVGRQARPGFEPGMSHLPVVSVTAVPLVEPKTFEGEEDLKHIKFLFLC